jgi:PAS domain S-box-containing protein
MVVDEQRGEAPDRPQTLDEPTPLSVSEARYRQLVTALVDGLFIAINDRIVYANPASLAMIGAKQEADVLGRSPVELVVPENRESARASQADLEERPVLLRRSAVVRLDGTRLPVDISAAAYDDPEGRALLILVRDVTERVRVESVIARLNGDLEARVAQRTEELTRANEALLQAEEELRQAADSARGSERLLREVIDLVPHLIFVKDGEGRFQIVNAAAARAYGASVSDLLGTRDYGLSPDPHSTEALLGSDEAVLAAGRSLVIPELHVKDRAGVDRFLSTVKLPFSLYGAPAVLNVSTDITDRREAELEVLRLNEDLEARVEQRTRDLASANRELESFAYSVSHDLRAPLRSVEGFGQALEEDYGSALPDGARDYLARMRAATQRMDALIDDLLRLSRVSRADLFFEKVDLAQLARAIARELSAQSPERKVHWEIQADLHAEADPRLLRIALENLLGNAWKFTAKKPDAVIEIGAIGPADAPTFFVRDNGAGFDMTYVDKLFVPFSRLHATRDFSGTGIGLATVQRIVARHGGRVHASGEVGRGATFSFTLNPRDPAEEGP